MSHPLEFTGERFVPGTAGEIAHEHWHRYAFARRFVAGRRVLDVACGEGYGSALLADVGGAKSSASISMRRRVAHARAAYAVAPNLRFEEGSAAALPLPDATSTSSSRSRRSSIWRGRISRGCSPNSRAC